MEIQLEPVTPENVRASSQQKDNVLKTPTQVCEQKDWPTSAAQQQRAISSRYVIDWPPQATTPDATFLKSFDSAMKILKEISPIKNSMTFQRERETTSKNAVDNLSSPTDAADILPKTSTEEKTENKRNFLFKKGECYPVDSKKTQLIR